MAPPFLAMHFQITTEAVGRYTPEQMRRVAYDVMPPGISIGLLEMMPDMPADAGGCQDLQRAALRPES